MTRSAVFLALLGVLALGRGAQALYDSSGAVTQLDANNFEREIKRKGGVWIVEFYAPWCGHCKALQPAWEQAAAALKGVVTVAAVDADAHGSLAQQYGVRGFPTIKLFYTKPDGSVAVGSQDYQGQRGARDIVSWAIDKARAYAMKRLGEPSGGGSSGGGGGGGSCGGGGGGGGAYGAGAGGGGGGSCGGGGKKRASGGGGGGSDGGFYSATDVVTLTDGNFDSEVLQSDEPWFVEFYAPWCGHCKALKPAWTDAASELKGKVNVGAIDCTAHQSTCSQYGVQGYPTIKFFGQNKDRPKDYQGGRDSGSIVSFGVDQWSTMRPPPEVRELSDPSVLESECLGAPGLDDHKSKPRQLCFFAFLPNILDTGASGRNDYLQILKDLAAKYKARPFGYLWAEGGKQPEIESALGVGGFGYPALVAYAPKDAKLSTMRSAFEAKHVNEFVENIRRGYEPVSPLAGGKTALPEAASVEPWDGGDAKVELEDEFSLDDIMGDDDKKEL